MVTFTEKMRPIGKGPKFALSVLTQKSYVKRINLVYHITNMSFTFKVRVIYFTLEQVS